MRSETRKLFVLFLAVIVSLSSTAHLAAALTLRIEGSVLRRASNKLVFSLGNFELRGAEEVLLKNRSTGEVSKIPLGSIYDDISYSVPLDEKTLKSVGRKTHTVYVMWDIDDEPEKLDEILFEIHEYQNKLRKSLGKQMVENGSFVSSRIVIGKIQKFHKIASRIVKALFEWGREHDRYALFSHPLRFEIEFSPDVKKAFGGNPGMLAKASKNLLMDEFERTLVSEFGFTSEEVSLTYNLPSTIKNFGFVGAGENEEAFVPDTYIEVPPSVLNALWYIHRQEIASEVTKNISLGLFNATLLKDKEIIRYAVNSTWVMGRRGDSAVLSAGKPFVKPGTKIVIETEKGNVRATVKNLVGTEYSITTSAEIPKTKRPIPATILRTVKEN